MHLKLVVFFAFFAYASALFGSEDIGLTTVQVTANQITLARQTGRQVTIITNQVAPVNGQQVIQIWINGPDVPERQIQIVDHQAAVGLSQATVLKQLFGQFSGVIDEVQYAKLFVTVADAIVEGQVDPAVLYAITGLSDLYQGHLLDSSYLNRIYQKQLQSLLTEQGNWMQGRYPGSTYGNVWQGIPTTRQWWGGVNHYGQNWPSTSGRWGQTGGMWLGQQRNLVGY